MINIRSVVSRRGRCVLSCAVALVAVALCDLPASASTSESTDGAVPCKLRATGGITLGDGIVVVPLRGWCVVGGKDGGSTLAITRGDVTMLLLVSHGGPATNARARVQQLYHRLIEGPDYVGEENRGIRAEAVKANELSGARLVWIAVAHKDRPKGPVTGGAIITHVRRDGWVFDVLVDSDAVAKSRSHISLLDTTTKTVLDDFANRAARPRDSTVVPRLERGGQPTANAAGTLRWHSDPSATVGRVSDASRSR